VELWGNGSSLTNSGLIRSSAPSAVVVQSQAWETITVLNTGTIEASVRMQSSAARDPTESPMTARSPVRFF
jgi:hypothetical protein